MISFFAKHPTAANLLMLILVSTGILSIRSLRRETFPDYSPAEVEVRVAYPGATATEVEETVCQRVEDALDGVRFVEELRSDAREGLAIVTAEMLPGGQYQAFKDEIDTEVAAIDDLPAETEDPVIVQLHTTDLVLSILVTGPLPLADLKAYCEDLKDRLQQQPEVSLVQIQGFSDHQLRVELSDEALRQYGLNATEIADIVQRQSVNLPAGAIEAREGELTIRFVEERQSPRELEELVIVANPGGAEIRLGDIARVSDLFELDEQKILLGDRRAGLLNVEIIKNRDLIRVADSVKDFIQAEQDRYPRLDFEITQDSSTLVQDRLKMLANNGWQGMLLVFLTMWLFFNVRLSFWVVMSLPVSFLGAFFFMPYLGLTINMMTTVGLLLALGILMDDGIVIAENIATHRAQGKRALEAAVAGVSEVKAGVFSSFITTVCVLGPLALLEGDIGSVLEVVPLVLILVLMVSLVEAFFILPAHLGHAMHQYEPEKAGRLRRCFDRFIEWARERLVGRCVDVLLRWRYLWIGVVLCLFLLSVGLIAGGVLEFQAFPDLDGDVIEARLLLAPGTPLERTEEVVR
ncbi:MAG: efflux RND transporter permease subunit, partial [Planctomycetota bacterium]